MLPVSHYVGEVYPSIAVPALYETQAQTVKDEDKTEEETGISKDKEFVIGDFFEITDTLEKENKELKQENHHLKTEVVLLKQEQAALFNIILNQNKEIMRLNQVIIEQQHEFNRVVKDMTNRQDDLHKRMKRTEALAIAAIGATALAVGFIALSSTVGVGPAFLAIGKGVQVAGQSVVKFFQTLKIKP